MSPRTFLLALMLPLAACAQDRMRFEDPGSNYGNWGWPVYSGGRYGDYGIGGRGAALLDPWLAETNPGQRLVLGFFDRNANGRIGKDRAAEANAWFRRYADRNGDLKITDQEIGKALSHLDGQLRRRGF